VGVEDGCRLHEALPDGDEPMADLLGEEARPEGQADAALLDQELSHYQR